MSVVRQLLRNDAIKTCLRRSYHNPNFKPVTLSDLPVPNGSWKADFDKKNAKYNLHLAAGVGFLIFTIVVAKTSGLVYLNYYPPESPEE